MPKLTVKAPKYRRHRASSQAVVTLNGRDIYLGRWNGPESKAEYHRLIGEWQASRRQLKETIAGNAPCIDQIILCYMEWARRYYRKNGKPTSTLDNVSSAMRPLQEQYGQAQIQGR